MKIIFKLLPILSYLALPVAYGQMNQWITLNDFENGDASIAETFYADWRDPEVGTPPTYAILTDPVDSNNHVFYWDPLGYGVSWQEQRISQNLPQEIADDQVGTLYFRVYHEGYGHDGNFGLSDIPVVPIEGEGSTSDLFKTFTDGLYIPRCENRVWGNFETQINMFNGGAGGSHILIRDGGGFATSDSDIPLFTWVEVWVVCDNVNDRSKVYYRPEGVADPISVIVLPKNAEPRDWANFRNGTTDPIVAFTFGGGAGTPATPYAGDPFYIDDIAIYVGAENIETPQTGMTWGHYPIVAAGDVDTGEWIGWINVTYAPYIWVYSLDGWVYMDEPASGSYGSWGYIFN